MVLLAHISDHTNNRYIPNYQFMWYTPTINYYRILHCPGTPPMVAGPPCAFFLEMEPNTQQSSCHRQCIVL